MRQQLIITEFIHPGDGAARWRTRGGAKCAQLIEFVVHPCTWLLLIALYEVECARAILLVFQAVILLAMGWELLSQVKLEARCWWRGTWATDTALLG
jgi:hypothetical protein